MITDRSHIHPQLPNPASNQLDTLSIEDAVTLNSKYGDITSLDIISDQGATQSGKTVVLSFAVAFEEQ